MMRRYILGADTVVEEQKRQEALWRESESTLAIFPAPAHDHSHKSTRIRHMKIGLYGWPVVVALPHTTRVRSTLPIGQTPNDGLSTEVGRAWADALGVSGAEVRAEGAVSVQRLAGLTPSQQYASLQLEANWISWRLQRQHTPIQNPTSRSNPGPPLKTAQWNMVLPPHGDDWIPTGPDIPAVFLLTAYVTWEQSAPPPVCVDAPQKAILRMQALMTALFTDGIRPAHREQEQAHATTSTASGMTGQRKAVPPLVRMGAPMPLQTAITQGQAMQFSWMAERAMKTLRNFSLSQAPQSPFLTWCARIDNDEGEIDAILEYTYDGFWRPASHVQSIFDQVNLSPVANPRPASTRVDDTIH